MDYVHGYESRETRRLRDQASSLVELLHSDTAYAPGTRILEAGCGVGAQTVTLATQSPHANFVSIDISAASLAEARQAVAREGLRNVKFHQADIFQLDFAPASFDHVFVCHVLEHLAEPVHALTALMRQLKVGGEITIVEGDHGSTYFHPDSEAAHRAIQCQVELQRRAGGDANIGRTLYPLLVESGYSDIRVSPRMVYVDSSRPELVEGFTKNTFTAMIEGVKPAALKAQLIDEPAFKRGIDDLYRTAEADGVFCYTFFKAVATRPKASS